LFRVFSFVPGAEIFANAPTSVTSYTPRFMQARTSIRSR